MSDGIQGADERGVVATTMEAEPPETAGRFDPIARAKPDLQDFIHRLVLPRLRSRHPEAASARCAGRAEQLLDILDLADERSLTAFLRSEHSNGSVTSLLQDVIHPACDVIGTLWAEDEMNFGEVTLQVGLLQRVLRQVLTEELNRPVGPLRVVLTTPPSEQHVFGAEAAAYRMRELGADAVFQPNLEVAELCRSVESFGADAVGIAVRAERHLPSLAIFFGGLRSKLFTGYPILVGGSLAATPAMQRLAQRFDLTLVGDDDDLNTLIARLTERKAMHSRG